MKFSTDRRWRPVALAIAVLLAPGTSSDEPPAEHAPAAATYGEARRAGTIDIPGLDELSGLAVSRLRGDVLWAHNDSGNDPLLFAVGTDGRSRGTFRIEGASEVDWEDVASFELDGVAYLVVGDVGDNDAERAQVRLMVVREPELPDRGPPHQGSLPIAWEVRLRYEDGPRDSEAVAVDRGAGEFLLMSKRTVPAAVYAVPIRPPAREPITARKIAATVNIPQPGDAGLGRALLGRYASQPTALDVSPDGRLAIVQTYTEAWLFRRESGTTWQLAFAAEPERVRIPRMAQVEAIAFDRAGRSLYVSTEVRPSPLFRLDRAEE